MYQFSPYELTIKKLDTLVTTLEKVIENGDYLQAEAQVATLREYKDCFYCVAYRKDTASRNKGVCDGCPVHKIGESMAGRPLAYNGCYKTSFYREMVRLSWFYKEEPSYKTAVELIKAIKMTKQHMIQYKKYLDSIVYKDI
jgi:hypothetical protein